MKLSVTDSLGLGQLKQVISDGPDAPSEEKRQGYRRIVMETIMALSSRINGLVWGIPMLVLMVGCGIFMSSRLGFVQFRRFGYTMRNTLGKMFDKTEVEDGALSPVQAMTTALAGTVGTGSIAGVAGAIALGGPGAVFWMWVAALFGMCTKFSEITLAVRYREKNEDGEWIGGPMYYIKNGLGKHWKWLGGLFAFFAACAAFGTGNMAQINTIATSIGSIFKAFDPAFTDAQLKTVYIVVGVAGAALTALVLFGGMKRIGAVTEKLVPVMALAYVACTAIVVFGHIGQIGFVFRQIFQGAFNPSAIGGGMAGAAILAVAKAGIGRGVFSNEAGLGTAPIAHASANVKHPVQQGIFGIFEVFTATFVICTMTALAILMSGMAPQFYGKSAGTDLTILAFGTTMGTKIASIVIALSIAMFAFSTILGWALYGVRSMEFLLGSKAVKPYQVIYVLMVFVGANLELALVWQIADTLNALMAIPNLIAVIALSPEVVRLTKEFFSREDQNAEKEKEEELAA